MTTEAYERARRENLARLAEQGVEGDEADRAARHDAALRSNEEWQTLRHQHPLSAVDATTELTLRRDRDDLEAEPDVVPTQITRLNRMMCGFGGKQGLAHGWSVIIGARSNYGKTTLALNLAVWAAEEGEHVLYVALEADAIDLRTRMLAIASGVHRDYLVYGDAYDRSEHERASESLTSLPGRIWLTSKPVYAMTDISQMVERFWEYQGVRTFIVDHLQLAQTGADKEIVRRVTEISHACRKATHEHRLLGISTSQLNRVAAVDNKRCPTMHDLLGGTSRFRSGSTTRHTAPRRARTDDGNRGRDLRAVDARRAGRVGGAYGKVAPFPRLVFGRRVARLLRGLVRVRR
jgi:replicative DNA helicase